jgi:hypothetical protein
MKRMGLARSLVLKEALYSIGGAKHTQIKEGKPWPQTQGWDWSYPTSYCWV